MAYQFHIDGEVFTGRTIPGAARMRLFCAGSEHFLAAFDPNNDSMYSDHPTGDWVDVPTYIDPEFLEKLKPQVISACLSRRRHIDKINQERRSNSKLTTNPALEKRDGCMDMPRESSPPEDLATL